MPTPTAVNINELPAWSGDISDVELFVVATPDGVAYQATALQLAAFFGVIAAGGLLSVVYNEAVGGSNIVTVATLIGKTVKMVFRSGAAYEVLTSGSPGHDQVLFDSVLGRLIFDAANPVGLNEKIITQYQ